MLFLEDFESGSEDHSIDGGMFEAGLIHGKMAIPLRTLKRRQAIGQDSMAS